MYPFSLAAFNMFFFISSFQIFNYDVFQCGMFVGPFSLLSLCFLDLWVCVFFYIWEVFSHYFIISFQPHSPSETLMLQMLDLSLLFHTFLWLCWLFFSVCFLFLLRLGNFSYSVFKFTDSVLYRLYYWVYPVFKFQLLCFLYSIFYNFHLILFYSFYLFPDIF